MLPERDHDLLHQVVHDVVGDAAQIEWEPTAHSWSAHVRLVGAWSAVEDPRSSVFITTSTDEDDVRDTLTKLARAAVEYLAGGGQVEQKRGLGGTRPVLVLHTVDGEWRIGGRTSKVPH